MSRGTSAWSNYWASGKASTFGRLDDVDSGASLVALWQELLSPVSESAVLDLGCGNGALGQILLKIAEEEGADLEVTGIDSAVISTEIDLPNSLTLIGETEIEHLPFEEDSFGHIVSQFGFEYADTLGALNEMFRVLRPGGRVTIIGHHRSAYVCRDSFDILRQMAEAEESALMVSVERLLTRLDILYKQGQAPEKDKTAEDLRKLVNGTVKELEESSKSHPNPGFTLQFLNSVMEVFKTKGTSLASHRQYLQELSESIVDYRIRLDSQKNVALDTSGWQGVKEQFQTQGFQVDRFEPSVVNGFHFGQLIQATKPG